MQQNVHRIILWGISASPYVRKVKIALEEKNLIYEQKEILPKSLLEATKQPIPEDFSKISPLGKVPVLQVGDFSIADSSAIIAYLDKKFSSGTPLFPTDAETFAKTIWFEHYADIVMTDIIYKKLFFEAVIKPKILKLEADSKLVQDAKENELPPILDYLNAILTSQEFITGEFSIADIAIATQLLALKMTGYTIDPNRWQALLSYLTKMLSRPSFSFIGV